MLFPFLFISDKKKKNPNILQVFPQTSWHRCLLQESGFVFMLYVRSKLDLGLNPSKLAGLIKRDRVGTVQDIISSLKDKLKRSVINCRHQVYDFIFHCICFLDLHNS